MPKIGLTIADIIYANLETTLRPDLVKVECSRDGRIEQLATNHSPQVIHAAERVACAPTSGSYQKKVRVQEGAFTH